MVKIPEADLTIKTGETHLALYQWNMKVAKHYFCKSCGIYLFHRKRAAPDHFGVNVHSLQGVDFAGIQVRATEGANMTVDGENSQPHWPGLRV